MPFRKQFEAAGGSLVIATAIATTPAFAADPEQQQELNQLRFELKQLRLINEGQAKQLRQLESRLTNLQDPSSPQDSNKPSPQPDQATSSVASADDTEEVKKEAGPSQSVENLLQEEHALFSRKLTFDIGMTYSHYDRKQLVLDGFLALDAIFLGDISVDDIESDIVTMDFGTRYNITDRWQVGLRIPFVSRYSTYTKSSSDSGVSETLQADVDTTFKLGDIELSSYYKLITESENWPDTVWSVRLKTPTGKDPYGIKNIDDNPDDSVDLTHPEELPTGSGLYALSTGFSFVKTTDPAILFASIEYTHQFAEGFDDISSEVGIVTPGEVRLGDSLAYGLGVAFAINERMSLSLSYSQRPSEEAETRSINGPWQEVVASDANAATFTTGLTYALSQKLSVSTSVGIGLTPDAPDFTFAIKFPFSI